MKTQILILQILLLLVGANLSCVKIKSKDNELEKFDKYLAGPHVKPYEGYYNIDGSKANFHIFKNFKLAAQQSGEVLTLLFVDAQCYGDRKYWNAGDVYAVSQSPVTASDTIQILLNEVRGDIKIPVEYHLKIEAEGFQIITKGENKRYIDHFKKITPDQVPNDFPFSEITYHLPTKEEKESLDIEYQSGLELMFWLSKLDATQLTTPLTIDGLNTAFDSLNQIDKYPIAEYNSVWHATFGLAIVFAETLKYEKDWQWIYVDESAYISPGWTLISKDKKLGISLEQIFYEKIMSKKPIDIKVFYKNISENNFKPPVKPGNIKFIELPCE